MVKVWNICTGCNVIYLKWLKNGSWSMIARSGSKRGVKIRHVWRMWIKSAAVHCPWGDADHAWPRRALSQRGAQGTPPSGTMVAGTRNGPWARLAGRSAILDAVYLKRLVMIVLFDDKTHKMFNTDLTNGYAWCIYWCRSRTVPSHLKNVNSFCLLVSRSLITFYRNIWQPRFHEREC